jgi:2-enoate reductase
MLDTVGLDMDSWIWVCLSAELAQRNVKILRSTKIEEITDEGVVLIDKSWKKTALTANHVVLALGLKRENRLAEELKGKVKEVFLIGDAKQPRRIQESVYEGLLTAYNL